MPHPFSDQPEGKSNPSVQYPTPTEKKIYKNHDFQRGISRVFVFGAIIGVYQFFNEYENFCWNIGIGSPCEYPEEYYYPGRLLLVLAISSIAYSIFQFTRREWRYATGLLVGLVLSFVLFIISTAAVFFMK